MVVFILFEYKIYVTIYGILCSVFAKLIVQLDYVKQAIVSFLTNACIIYVCLMKPSEYLTKASIRPVSAELRVYTHIHAYLIDLSIFWHKVEYYSQMPYIVVRVKGLSWFADD